jgi:PilZ domain
MIMLPTQEAPLEAYVLDISLGGVRLICSEPLSQGADALLSFRITTRKSLRIEEVFGRVVHIQVDDDAWVMGLKFDQALDGRRTPLLAQAAAKQSRRP